MQIAEEKKISLLLAAAQLTNPGRGVGRLALGNERFNHVQVPAGPVMQMLIGECNQ